MRARSQENIVLVLVYVGLLSWLIPGGGYFFLKETKRATIMLVAIVLTFGVGLYIGSIGVIDPVGSWPWFIAQIMNSPMVALLGHLSAGGGFPVYGRPNEIGQIYTSIAGLLNLLCIINAVQLAYLQRVEVCRD